MPDLTPEQKEHFKMAHRANMRIEETWQLFTMFLSQDKKPLDALEMAREAVTVWAEWMDQNEVEPPDIQRPDFGEQLKDAMKIMTDRLPTFPMPMLPIAQFLPQPPNPEVDAEFNPDDPLGILELDRDAEVDGLAARRREQTTPALPSAENPAGPSDPNTK
jgi:hypothetical protein